MASVTVYSTTKVDTLLHGTVTEASITSDSHIILTHYDGTTEDLGSALVGIPDGTDVIKGLVEFATDTETIAGSAADRAVTPLSLSAALSSALTAARVTSGVAESAAPTSYPVGTSVMALTTSSWSLNSGNGLVVTMRIDTTHATQTFYTNNGGTHFTQSWTRTYHATDGGGGWTAWQQNVITVSLTAASFTQATAHTSYPVGRSRLYYTTANSTSWDFSGSAGEVITNYDGSGYARQEFTLHPSGSTTAPAVWIRTANTASGWSPWQVVDNSSRPRFNGGFSGTITNGVNTDLSPSTISIAGGITVSGANITVPVAGEYEIGVVIRYASQATASGMRVARFNVNAQDRGFFVVPVSSAVNATNVTASGVSRLILAANDVVKFQAYQSSGGNLGLQTDSHCWIERKH